MMSSFSPSIAKENPSASTETSFWKHFAKNHWEQKELVTDNPALAGPMSEEELFRIVSRLPESPFRGPFVRPWYLVLRLINKIFLRSSERIEPRVLLHFVIESRWKIVRRFRIKFGLFVSRKRLPRPEDGSFLGYHERISRELNPSWRRFLGLQRRRYCLKVYHPEMASFKMWEATSKKITTKLYKQVGMSNGGYYYEFFIGDYSRSPIGVHRDDESLFHFPVVGTKAVRLWSPEFVQQHPDIKGCLNYKSYKDGSILVKAGPGQTIYWPSKYWHIGEAEAEGQFSVSLALGLVVRSEPKLVTQNTTQLRFPLREFDPKTVPFDPDNLQRSVETIPLGVLRPTDGRAGWKMDTPTAAWLRAVTSIGALFPPTPDHSIVISDEDIVCGHPYCPVVSVPCTDHQLLIGVAGHVFSAPNTYDVRGLIAFANSRSTDRVSSLVGRFSEDLSDEDVRNLLRELVQCRGLVRLPEPKSPRQLYS